MATGSIVEHHDVIKDIGLGEVSRFVDALLDTFLFQTTKEGFSDGVVPRADVRALPEVFHLVDERCNITGAGQVTAKALYAAYRKWAEDSGVYAVNQMRFGLAMVERGFHESKERGGVVYRGIELPVSDHMRYDA